MQHIDRFGRSWACRDAFDRIKRGTVRIPTVNISLFGDAQPQRIATYPEADLDMSLERP